MQAVRLDVSCRMPRLASSTASEYIDTQTGLGNMASSVSCSVVGEVSAQEISAWQLQQPQQREQQGCQQTWAVSSSTFGGWR